jgi:redox-sensitive bicupin YhaK (pirin superfamily)
LFKKQYAPNQEFHIMAFSDSPYKKIKYLLPAIEVDMGGFPVKQAIPTQKVQQVDPFLLLHHASVKTKDDRPAKAQGVGPHPHRGFSPVTFVIDGEVHHRDSRGNSQIAKTGDVQWMHAGAGIVHSERPSEALASRSGRQEIIQLWINSPAAQKMQPPEYQYLPESDMPLILSDDGKVRSKLVAGTYGTKHGKIKTQSQLLVLWGSADATGEQTLKIPEGFSSILYLINGSMRLKAYGIVEPETLSVFGPEGDTITMAFQETAQFLLLCGAPIDEDVTQYGPYVMNTQTEILEAMRDYQMGKMGILIEED